MREPRFVDPRPEPPKAEYRQLGAIGDIETGQQVNVGGRFEVSAEWLRISGGQFGVAHFATVTVTKIDIGAVRYAKPRFSRCLFWLVDREGHTGGSWFGSANPERLIAELAHRGWPVVPGDPNNPEGRR